MTGSEFDPAALLADARARGRAATLRADRGLARLGVSTATRGDRYRCAPGDPFASCSTAPTRTT